MLPDWVELCNLLNAHSVEYLVVGGQAVIAHGFPRLTKDMDLADAEELEKIEDS